MNFGKTIPKGFKLRKQSTVFTEAFALALKQKGYGAIGELANICLVSRSTIVHWRDGICLPLFLRWIEIEEYLGWELGTIDYLISQEKHAS